MDDRQDGADIDDDGAVDLSDPVTLLRHLFLGADRPPEPFGACGTDRGIDTPGCRSFPPCR